jgi:hypothetical protein
MRTMSDLDDRLRREVQGAASRVPVHAVFEILSRRRRRREVARLGGIALLSTTVIAASLASVVGLRRVFEPSPGGIGGGGVIAFSRVLRDCGPHTWIGGPQEDVFAVSLDGDREWNLTEGGSFLEHQARSEQNPAFSPDGARFAWFDRYRKKLYLTEVVSGETHVLVDGIGAGSLLQGGAFDPAWSPDGRLIAFSGMDQTPDPRFFYPASRIFVVDAAGGGATQLTDGDQDTNDGWPKWSPDGQTLAFLRTRTLDPVDEGEAASEQALWFMNVDGTDQREVATQPKDATFSVVDGDWSPDGTRFVAEVDLGRQHDLFVVNIDGRTGYRLTDHPAWDTSPTWSPDGQWIAFQTGRWGNFPGHAEIAVVRTDGSDLTRLTHDCWGDYDPFWVANPDPITALAEWTPAVAPPPPEGSEVLDGGYPVCNVERLEADLRGEGVSRESVWVYSPTNDAGTRCPDPGQGSRTLAVDTDGIRAPDVTWGPLPCRPWCVPLAAVDVNGDGRDEILVNEGHLAQPASAIVSLFTLDPEAEGASVLARVSFPDERDRFEIVSSGSQVMGGAYCRHELFHVWTAPTPDTGATYELVDRAYRLTGSPPRFELVDEERSIVGWDGLPADPHRNVCGEPISIG